MAIVPNSTVRLYKDVDIDNDETLAFTSDANRDAYFDSKLLLEHVNCRLIKKTGQLKLTVDWNTINQANYMSFVNPSFGNKIYYCKIIVDPDASTDKTCVIDYQIDWWITDMHNLKFEECYIEREYLSIDDYNKSVENPYDPSIMEFRTNEVLPVNKDIEKPFYEYGNSNTYDGVFAAEAICHDNSIENKMGMLLVFSDIAFDNIDGGTATVASPSAKFWGYLTSIIYTGSSVNNNFCFFRLSPAVYRYLRRYDTTVKSAEFGGKWGSLPWSTSGAPGASNKIIAPVSYVYIDEVGPIDGDIDYDNPTPFDYFSQILGWFTDNECLECILGVYPVPTGLMAYACADDNTPVQIKMPTAASQNVVNKKLDLYPYTYYRIIAPNGDIKELRIEDFYNAQHAVEEQGHVYCDIALSMDIVEKPNLLVAPQDYKANGTSPSNPQANINAREGLVFSQFPTLPYAIDAFTAQMASVANNIIGNNTVDYQYDVMQRSGGIGKQVKGGLKAVAADMLGKFASLFSGEGAGTTENAMIKGGRMIAEGMEFQASYEAAGYNRLQNEMNMSNEAYDILSGSKDNALYDNFQYTRPAYGASQYHQINGDGTMNYNINSFIDILIMRVSINPAILQEFDKYFTLYGYSSGKCKLPYIYRYVRNSQEDLYDEVQPHWNELGDKHVTYVKTVDLKIVHSNMVAASYVRQMFNSGCRFINGDELIP